MMQQVSSDHSDLGIYSVDRELHHIENRLLWRPWWCGDVRERPAVEGNHQK
jgi:hypothetical protein